MMDPEAFVERQSSQQYDVEETMAAQFTDDPKAQRWKDLKKK